jgi:pyruvate dehydrogenase E1 component alpha subunit
MAEIFMDKQKMTSEPRSVNSKDILARLYRTMLKIRFTEESLVEPIINMEICCPCDLCTGQEAIATGVCAALTKRDIIFGNHRSHGHYIAKGGDLLAMLAEIYGLEKGTSRGRGGSMHLIDTANGMLGAAPIVAGTISLAVGAALAIKIKEEKHVAVSFFGDGATGEGILYESLNYSALKKLPLIFVCENNLYSTHMPIRECRPEKPIADIGKAFGIECMQIDGNDVLQVYDSALKAVDICKKGEGPVFIECLTYRWRGHVGPDDNIQGTRTDIRPKTEIMQWYKKDPIERMERILIKNKYFNEECLAQIRFDIDEEVQNAHRMVKKFSTPEIGGLTKYVFKE